MYWLNGSILSYNEVIAAAAELPSSYQVGEPRNLYLEDIDDDNKVKTVTVPSFVVGVKIKARGEVYYDLAVPIMTNETELENMHFAVIENQNLSPSIGMIDQLSSLDLQVRTVEESSKPKLTLMKFKSKEEEE